jgi:hypothetical protein
MLITRAHYGTKNMKYAVKGINKNTSQMPEAEKMLVD